ncbi:MAG: hypothetical protein COA96_01680 [SAR86 cluster bacterium]|uniref:Glycosyltransferase 2-like domain-containing protein n=1 Tax=SAR86 cluster bacterium TaxID=2030880 RepID=A0A2A5B9L0_9GAMM|nr:MAG: hypothetical protein COA96_01680 [SAR86 cluster bacterium]
MPTESSVDNNNPLVSVICRTIGRCELQQALQSISVQTYPNLEIILVNAAESTLDNIQSWAGNITTAVISPGHTLKRSEAANAGLQAANGHWLMFLDDDDWVAEDHVKNLVDFLQGQSEVSAAYSSTQKTDSHGEIADGVFDIDFDPLLLMRDNYIPIHAMVFAKSLIDKGCRFDEAFNIYEDWDFWLQLNQFTAFKHIHKLTAFYRGGGDFDTTIESEQVRYQSEHSLGQGRAAVFDKWLTRWNGDDINQLLGHVDQSIEVSELEHQIRRVSAEARLEKERTASQIGKLKHEIDTYKQQLAQTKTDYTQLLLNHQELDAGVKEILNSFSWKITKPYRFVGIRLRKYLRGSSAQPAISSKEGLTDVAINACDLVLKIESPEEKSDPAIDALNIRGWLFSPSGIESIRIKIDSSSYPLPKEAERSFELLANSKSREEAARIGFNFKLALPDLSPGEHILTIEARDHASNESIQSIPFVFLDSISVYQNWIKNSRPSKETSHKQLIESENLQNPPVINLILYAHASTESIDDRLLNTIKSLLTQTYKHWRCYLLGTENLNNYGKMTELDSERIQCVDDLSQAVLLSVGSPGFTGFVELGETFTDSALWDFVADKQEQAEVIYFDHDIREANGRRVRPVFTFSWSSDHLMSSNYVGGIYFIANNFLSEKWPNLPTSELFFKTLAWRYELLLCLTGLSSQIQRIPKILWSGFPLSDTASLELFEDESERVRKYLGWKAAAVDIISFPEHKTRHIKWRTEESPMVSIVIPTTGNLKFVKPCIESIRDKTEYQNFEIIVLDNGRGAHPQGIDYIANLQDPTIKLIECDQAFNWSRLNNIGVEHSKGELLLFLNDDIEVLNTDWLGELVRQAVRSDVGVVGSLLLYPNGAIQHAGVFLVDHGGGARHLFHKIVPDSGNYQNLDLVVRETSAVTGACMMIDREKFIALGKFDENLPIAGNDIDLCLRAIDSGYRNVWTPYSKLIHHESVSRKNTPILKDEQRMWKNWGHYFEKGDPYYNPNLSLQSEDCSLREYDLQSDDVSKSSIFQVQDKSQAGVEDVGVNLIAYIRAEMGVGEAARGNANALNAANIPFGILNIEDGNPSRMDNLRWHHKETLLPEYDINLIHINADHIPNALADLGEHCVANKYNIGYWAWELPEFPDKWLSSFEHLDEIWTPSTFVNDAISMKSPVPVITIPHAIELTSKFLLSKKDLGLPENRFLFLCMFDTHSVNERKNPAGAITAFMRAFEKNDTSTALIIKVNNVDENTLNELEETIADYSNIIILGKHLDRDSVDSLLINIDCFLSLHRAEGFGLGPAEAMFLGKVALLTNWSGNLQYMTDSNCLRVNYQLKKLEKDFGPYEAGQIWAQPDYEHAAELMRKLVSDPALAKSIGENARNTIQTNFSAKAIGSQMKKRLSSIQRIIAARSPNS